MRWYEDGLVHYRFENLDQDRVEHAVFTRLGGVSQGEFASLNVGASTGDDETAIAENHARIFAQMGAAAGDVITAHQVHGHRVAVVTHENGGAVMPNTDGLATCSPGVTLVLRFADCQPVLLYDPVNHAMALVHAGWRGIALNIATRAVETMQAAFGTEPHSLLAGLGPAIGPCCYTVGDNVAAAMGYALPKWSQVMQREGDTWRFDLPAANVQQLRAAGVRNIERAQMCTACRTDQFYSHRASGGRTGRFAVAARLKNSQMSPRPVRKTTQSAPQQASHASARDSLHPPGFPPFGEGTEDAP